MKCLLILLLALSLIVTVSAIEFEARTGLPNHLFNYQFNFTTNSDCTGVLLSYSDDILTDSNGNYFFSIPTNSLTSVPNYLCEYKDSALRKTHNFSDIIFRSIRVRNITTQDIHSNDWTNVTITESQISDLDHFTNADETDSKAYNGTLAYNSSLADYLGINSTANNSIYLEGYNVSMLHTYLTSLNDLIYYSILNPFNFYNSTDFSIGDYYLNSNPYSFYNSTNPQIELDSKAYNGTLAYLSDILGWSYYNSTDFSIGDYYTKSDVDTNITSANNSMKSYVDSLDTATNTSLYNWVVAQSYLTTFSELDTLAYNGTLMYASNWNATNESYYLKSNPYTYWNSTFATFNKTYADTIYLNLLGSNANSNIDIGIYNFTANQFDGNWNGSINYYLKSNPYSFYNSTSLDLSGYVPYTGATTNVNLGIYNITTGTGTFGSLTTKTPGFANVVNGDFGTGNLNGWTSSGNWAVVTGQAKHSANAVNTLQPTTALDIKVGKTYKITFDAVVNAPTNKWMSVSLGGVSEDIKTTETIVRYFTATNTNNLVFTATAHAVSGFYVIVDNVVVEEYGYSTGLFNVVQANITGPIDLGDSGKIEIGVGGTLGADAIIKSDGTNVYFQIQGPTNNPKLVLKTIDISGTDYPVIGSSMTDTLALDRILYVQSTTGAGDGSIFVPHKNYPTTNAFLQIFYDSTNNLVNFRTDNTAGTTDLYMNIDGDTYWNDNKKVKFGTGKNSSISYSTNLNFITNESGTGIAWFSSNISGHNLIDRTWYWDNDMGDALDYFQLTEVINGSDKNLHDFEQATYLITDLDRPEYKEVCSLTPITKQEECEFEVYYPYQKNETGRSITAVVGKFEQAIAEYRTATDVIEFENYSALDTKTILTDNIYTKSKTISDGVDYFYNLKDKDKLKDKTTHYAFTTLLDMDGNTYETLNLEDRIVQLEGFANALMTELCFKNNNAYSWCLPKPK